MLHCSKPHRYQDGTARHRAGRLCVASSKISTTAPQLTRNHELPLPSLREIITGLFFQVLSRMGIGLLHCNWIASLSRAADAQTYNLCCCSPGSPCAQCTSCSFARSRDVNCPLTSVWITRHRHLWCRGPPRLAPLMLVLTWNEVTAGTLTGKLLIMGHYTQMYCQL